MGDQLARSYKTDSTALEPRSAQALGRGEDVESQHRCLLWTGNHHGAGMVSAASLTETETPAAPLRTSASRPPLKNLTIPVRAYLESLIKS
jgi:hypothetical protein